MNYTDEEFYGNKQNTVLETGEVIEAGKEEDNKKQEQKIGMTVFLTSVKTLIVLVCSIFYVFSAIIALSPKTAIEIFDFIGADNASLGCYERIYKKRGSLADLYNLVQKSISNKNHEKTAKYIKELQSKSKYLEFCLEVNDATLQATEKKYWAYVGDLDSYLVSQNIIAEYLKGDKEKALGLALADLNNENVYSFGLSAYLSCLFDDKSLTAEDKNSVIIEISQMFLEDQQNILVLSKIKERRIEVDLEFNNGGSNDKILRVYTSLKIENVLLEIYEATNEEGLVNQTRDQIAELQDKYDELIA